MNEKEYSFFYLTSNQIINFAEDEKIENYNNKIWTWRYERKNHLEINVNKLYWIDLLNYKNRRVYGKIDEVEIWSKNSKILLVFTSSYSIVNMIRLYLKEEWEIETQIEIFSQQTIKRLANCNICIIKSMYIKGDKVLTKIYPNKVFKKPLTNDVFAIDLLFNQINSPFSIFLSINGLVKLSYGANEYDLMKVCDLLEVNF